MVDGLAPLTSASPELTTLVFKYIPYEPYGLDDSLDERIIQIKNIIPEELSYSYSPQFSSQAVLGRMSPIQLYTGGSDMVYSFVLTLHEDALSRATLGDYNNIKTLTDDLKALAYPYIDLQGLQRAQRVYFQVGDIAGYGHVKVGVSWKKPFRNGRYIQSDISITLTAETIFPKADYEVKVEPNEEGNESYATYYPNIIVTSANEELLTQYGDFLGYDISCSDFIMNDARSDEEKLSNISYIENYFDVNIERLSRLVGVIDEKDDFTTDGQVANLLAKINDVSNLDFDAIQGAIQDKNKYSVSALPFLSNIALYNIESLRKDLVEYIETYYKEIDDDITQAEIEDLINDVNLILTELTLMFEEVAGYGAGI